jgi:pantetheine-phosphate adenylyltransferase
MYSQELLNKYGIRADINMILDIWNESHRKFHNLDHLSDLVGQINESHSEGVLDEKQTEKLLITAMFHDIVYEPDRQDNEERSAEFLMNLCEDKSNKDILEIRDAILDTKHHLSASPLAETFNRFDMNVIERDFDHLMKWEEGISAEYVPFYGEEMYKEGRLKFLESLLDKYPTNMENLIRLIDVVKGK